MIFFTVVIFQITYNHPVRENVSLFYSSKKLQKTILSKIKFEDVTEKWNIVYDHAKNTEGSNKLKNFLFPSITVYDFDDNGFLDIFYSGGNRNFLFLNLGNGQFQESAKTFGIDCENDTSDLNSQAILADLNGDGTDDLYLATTGKHRLFIREKNTNHFKEETQLLGGYASFSHGINFLDFNQDGRLDIVVANFYELGTEYRKMEYVLKPGTESNYGTINNLLLQDSNGAFKSNKVILNTKKSMSNSVGVSDINNDGFPDIFFANDYGPDQLLLNQTGKSTSDVTSNFLPKKLYLNGGKNAEFVDFDQDGLIDLFVTNAYIPPYQLGFNMLWKKKSSKGDFELVSLNKNIGKSGLSWGAKFADFNLDGKLDVFVANGLERDERSNSINDEKSLWYGRSEFSLMPLLFRGKDMNFLRNPNMLYHRFAFERDSLFIQYNNDFYDVAVDVGLNDDREGRGVAIADLNNDGLMDIIVTNYKGPSKVYLNKSTPSTSWIGFTMHDSKGSKIPIGAKVKLKQSSGPDLVKEYYPANGFHSQSDHRLLFSLNQNSHFLSLEILWPSKIKKTYKGLTEKKYNDVYEK